MQQQYSSVPVDTRLGTTRSVSRDTDFTNVIAFLHTLVRERFFGRVELTFQSGKVHTIHQNQSLKIEDLTELVAKSQGANDGGLPR